MSSTDRSQTERIRRIRSKLQAVRRSECPSCLEEGPIGPVDQSTRVSRKFGQMIYYRQNAVGVVTAENCCSSSNVIVFNSCNQSVPFSFQAGTSATITNNTDSYLFLSVSNDWVSQLSASLLSPHTSRTEIIPTAFSGILTGYCTFPLTIGVNQTISGPNLVGRNETGGLLDIISTYGNRTLQPGEAVGPFQIGDVYSVV